MKTNVDKFGNDEYEDVVESIIKIYDDIKANAEKDDNIVRPEAKLAACLLRFAGHDLMDYREKEDGPGGSDGCIDM